MLRIRTPFASVDLNQQTAWIWPTRTPRACLAEQLIVAQSGPTEEPLLRDGWKVRMSPQNGQACIESRARDQTRMSVTTEPDPLISAI